MRLFLSNQLLFVTPTKNAFCRRLFYVVTGLCAIFFMLPHVAMSAITDSSAFSVHFQTTVINQWKSSFYAPYSGDNSLQTQKESRTSLTSTLALGWKPWKGAGFFLNPEIAGGSGLSKTLGIASATNGETFRVGDAAPQVYLARLYYRQVFALSRAKTFQASGFNALTDSFPLSYVSFSVGKMSVADFFDDNRYSHNPRSQFFTWGLMDAGAWDYPANTRGYSSGAVVEYVRPSDELRYSIFLMPKEANGNVMNFDVLRSQSQAIEYTHRYSMNGRKGALRILAFYTSTSMGNYRESLHNQPLAPDISDSRRYGRTKKGGVIGAEQELTKNLGGFFRISWNDGTNETWAFTDIDHSICAGLSLSGSAWKRPYDVWGFGGVFSGISNPHRAYLAAGGKSFMLGDGRLTYTWEKLLETYYSANIYQQKIFVSGAFQYVQNPGYNRDRKGPVPVFSLRMHAML